MNLRVFALAALLATTAAARAAQAPQSAPQSPADDLAVTISRLEGRQHVGSPRDALVGIGVTITSPDDKDTIVRHGNGFVVRCDGFILAPYGLFDCPQGYRIVTEVHLRPGDPNGQVVRGIEHPFHMDSSTGLVALKLRNVHMPAARTLLASSLAAGTELEVVWSPWDAAKKRFGPIRLGTMKLTEPTGTPPGSHKPLPYAINVEALPEGVIAGAVAIGPEERAVGFVPGKDHDTSGLNSLPGAMPARITSFELMHRATNCMGVVPISDTAYREAVGASKALAPGTPTNPEGDSATPPALADSVPPAGMVLVPGGPVWLPIDVVGAQHDMQGGNVACMPSFYIDRLQVTNNEYYDFWKTLPQGVRTAAGSAEVYFPLGWAESGQPFPDKLGRHPVLGVTAEAAMAYARSKGKRLPTPYEMLRAAYGPRPGEVLPQWFWDMRQQRIDTGNELLDTHRVFREQNPDLGWLPDGGPEEQGLWCYPFIVERNADLYASNWSRTAADNITRPLWQAWHHPNYVVGVGERPFDASPYLMLDALLNAAHMVLPPPWFPMPKQQCYLFTTWRYVPPPNPLFEFTYVIKMRGEKRMPRLPLSLLLRKHISAEYLEYLTIETCMYDALQIVWPLNACEVHMAAREFELDTVEGHGPSIQRVVETPPRVKGFTIGPADVGLTDDHPKNRKWVDYWAGWTRWMTPPSYLQREMGRPTAMEEPNLRLPKRLRFLDESAHVPPELVYLFPGGFRCAR